MRVAFVEIQAPIIDTHFFKWFLEEVSAMFLHHSYQVQAIDMFYA
jgi:hypothetical protein